MKKFAVLLSGNGVYDGAEIHEATMTLYALSKQNVDYDIFAPNIDQHHVINHLTGEEMNEKRNVLVESARIARGKISSLSDFKAENYDALMMPGGFGVAKNFSDFAFKGADCNVNDEVANAILDTNSQGKPIGALCISPAIVAKVLKGAKVTIGTDKATAEAIEKMGGENEITNHGDVTVDKKLKIYTTPCYMLDATIVNIADGAMNIVEAILKDL